MTNTNNGSKLTVDLSSLPSETETVVITCIFNPAGYKSKLVNFWKFYNHTVKTLKIPVYVAHLVERLENSEIFNEIGDYCQIFHCEVLLWHKEALLNEMAKQFMGKKNIIFADADILFPDDPTYLSKIEKICDDGKTVFFQPFSKVNYLTSDGLTVENTNYSFCHNIKNYQSSDYKGNDASFSKRVWRGGATGMCWVLSKQNTVPSTSGPWFEKAIIGGGDYITAHCGLVNKPDLNEMFFITLSLHPLMEDIQNWTQDIHPHLGKNRPVDYVDAEISHLYHGSREKRDYLGRHAILQTFTKQNWNGLQKKSNGLYSISPATTRQYFESSFINYISSRCEDATDSGIVYFGSNYGEDVDVSTGKRIVWLPPEFILMLPANVQDIKLTIHNQFNLSGIKTLHLYDITPRPADANLNYRITPTEITDGLNTIGLSFNPFLKSFTDNHKIHFYFDGYFIPGLYDSTTPTPHNQSKDNRVLSVKFINLKYKLADEPTYRTLDWKSIKKIDALPKY